MSHLHPGPPPSTEKRRNLAISAPCKPATGFSSGPSGTSRAVYEVASLQPSDVIPALPVGTYYARFHVTFPDSTVGEVDAGKIARF